MPLPKLGRPGSGRDAREVKCQHPDCGETLSLSAIPVEFESILKRLFGGDAPAAPSPLAATAGALPRPVPLSHFASCEARGDAVSFVALVAECVAGGALAHGDEPQAPVAAAPATAQLPLPWPYCDDCLVRVKRARDAEVNAARAREAASKELRDALTSATSGAAGGSASPTSAARARGRVLLRKALDEEEARLASELFAARGRAAVAAGNLTRVRASAARVAVVRAGLWSAHSALASRLADGRARMDALSGRAARGRDALARLRGLRVFSDAYYIWHADPFATINGARLGRVPGAVPEWAETNAALGQLALLLSLTASRLGCVFSKWRVIPYGSFSKLAPPGDERSGAPLELFYDGAFFGSSRLSAALRALCFCVAELGAFVEARDPSFRMPYPITGGGDKVAGLATALGKDVPWTRALRCVATDLKWLVSYAAAR